MKDRLRALFATALAELDVGGAVRRALRRDGNHLLCAGERLDLAAVRTVFVVAIGKAARPMAAAALPLLAGARVQGVLVPPRRDDDGAPLPPLELLPGDHPVPDAGSVHAAERTLVLLGNAGERDLVLYLLSGGGSALFERPPAPEVPLAELQTLYRHLLGCGADILAVNAVRKHLSAVKGGRLAHRAAAARQWTLLLSDVPPARPDAVASGPTLPARADDPLEGQENGELDGALGGALERALAACGLAGALPVSYARLVRQRQLLPMRRGDDRAFARARCAVLLDEDAAADALLRAAAAAGFAAERLPARDDWTAPQLAEAMLRAHAAAVARADEGAGAPGRIPVAIVAAGELAVALPPHAGTGGRNQQFALHLAQRIAGRRLAALSAGTDGRDGNAPCAGAVVDGETIARARQRGLDAAAAEARCDAHPFFTALDDLVTAPPGNNLRDLRILVDLT